MRNMTIPARAVSFEDALRNLASKLTGKPASALPRTQEGVVQYMAEHIPSLDELAEAFLEIYRKAQEDPEWIRTAPHTTPITRLDEVGAARNPRLHYEFTR